MLTSLRIFSDLVILVCSICLLLLINSMSVSLKIGGKIIFVACLLSLVHFLRMSIKVKVYVRWAYSLLRNLSMWLLTNGVNLYNQIKYWRKFWNIKDSFIFCLIYFNVIFIWPSIKITKKTKTKIFLLLCLAIKT